MNGSTIEIELICQIDMLPALLFIELATYRVSSRGHYIHIIGTDITATYVRAPYVI